MRSQVASMQTALAKAAQDLTAASSRLVTLEEENAKLLKQVAEPRRQIDELMARIREMKAANDDLTVLERELRAWLSQVGALFHSSLRPNPNPNPRPNPLPLQKRARL